MTGLPEPGPAVTLTTIGDIAVTERTVITPAGTFPIAGTTWTLAPQTQEQTRIPGYAIVLAIVFALACLIGLLFLLIKEKTVSGYVQVSVQGPGLYHSTHIQVSSYAQVQAIQQHVDYARTLAVRAASL